MKLREQVRVFHPQFGLQRGIINTWYNLHKVRVDDPDMNWCYGEFVCVLVDNNFISLQDGRNLVIMRKSCYVDINHHELWQSDMIIIKDKTKMIYRDQVINEEFRICGCIYNICNVLDKWKYIKSCKEWLYLWYLLKSKWRKIWWYMWYC